MDYLAQLNAFAEYTSVETIPVNAFAVYMRMLFLNNRLRWQEWFSVTYERLCAETGINSKHTIMTAVNVLEQKKFIAVQRGKKKQPNLYKIVPLYGANFAPQTEQKSVYGANFDTKAEQKGNTNGTETEQKGNKSGTQPAPIIRHRQDEEKDVDDPRATTTANFSSAVKFFDDNFHAITPHEFDVLGSLVDDFGEEKTLRAMTLAVERDARNIRYVKAVLEGWERDGGENTPKSDGGEKPDEWQTRGNWTQYTDEEAAELLRRDEERRAANKARQEAEYEEYKARADRRAKERAKWLNWQPPA